MTPALFIEKGDLCISNNMLCRRLGSHPHEDADHIAFTVVEFCYQGRVCDGNSETYFMLHPCDRVERFHPGVPFDGRNRDVRA